MLAVEKIITSKLLKPGANKRIATVDRHVGIVSYTVLRSLAFYARPSMAFLLQASTFLAVQALNDFIALGFCWPHPRWSSFCY